MTNQSRRKPGATAVAVAGLLSLAVAMGIGRFAFTPMLPLMANAELLTVAQGSWLAAANYVGYFGGALVASRVRFDAARLATVSLVLIACSTAAMAVPGAAAWMTLRLVAGACSAWVFVATSVWCLGALSSLQRTDLGAWVYSGVGAGIAAAGLHCLLAAVSGVRPDVLWIQLGILAAALSLPVMLVIRRVPAADVPGGARGPGHAKLPAGTVGLVVSYGIMGYGYILPATFLPLLARNLVTDPAVFGWAWPIFGLTAAASTLAAGMAMKRRSRLQVWTVCQLLMGMGALVPSLWSHPAAIVLSAVLVGGTFMVITLAGVQEIRARAGENAAQWVGYLTASFALGQIAGPVASSLLLVHPGLGRSALDLGLQSAAILLFLSSAWLWRQANPSRIAKEMQDAG